MAERKWEEQAILMLRKYPASITFTVIVGTISIVWEVWTWL